MRYEVIFRNNGNEVARTQTGNSEVGFRTVLGYEEMSRDFGFEEHDSEIFVTDKDEKITHVLIVRDNERRCDGKDYGRLFDSVVSFWF